MQLRPSPELVWRTATRPHQLGGVQVVAGDMVVVAVVSATHECLENGDPDVSPIFGGQRSKLPHPTHACPAYDAAMGVLHGFMLGLLAVPEAMRPTPVPLVLTFTGPFVDAAPPPGSVPQLVEGGMAAGLQQAAIANSAAVFALKGRAPLQRTVASTVDRAMVIGIGDSWFDYFAMDVFDVFMDDASLGLGRSFSLAMAGTALTQLESTPQLIALDSRLQQFARKGVRPRAILLSAGGDDVVNQALLKLLLPKGARTRDNQGLDEPAVRALVDRQMRAALVSVLDTVMAICKAHYGATVPIVVHGYDYPYPDGRGPLGTSWDAWLRPEFAKVGYTADADLPACHATMTALIDRLNAMQAAVAARYRGAVIHADLTGTLRAARYREDWSNELHPTVAGFTAIASALAAHLP
jgi:hypothetical protein